METRLRVLAAVALPFAAWGCATSSGLQVRQVSSTAVAPSGGAAMAQGRMLYSRGEYALAIDQFRRVVRENPELPDGYNALASSYDMIGRFDLARLNYEMALARAPSDGRIYRNMARSLRMQGRDHEAEELLAEFRAIDTTVQTTAAVPAPDMAPATAIQSEAPAQLAEAPPAATPVPAVISPVAPVVAIAPPVVTPPATALPSQPVARGTQLVVNLDPPKPAVQTAPATNASPTLTGRTVKVALDAPPQVRSAALSAIRILNAGATKGAARRMQGYLAQGGVPASIGDANRKLAQSWIVYPRSRRAEAMELQRRLPFSARAIADNRVDRVTVLIGSRNVGAKVRTQGSRA